jgi:hypothetical protein
VAVGQANDPYHGNCPKNPKNPPLKQIWTPIENEGYPTHGTASTTPETLSHPNR